MIGKILIICQNVGYPNSRRIFKVGIITKIQKMFNSNLIFYILPNSLTGLVSVTNHQISHLNCTGSCIVNYDIPKLILL